AQPFICHFTNFLIQPTGIWLFIYVLKTKFYLGQSSPEYATGCYFGLLQGLNFLVICHFIILICGIDIQDSFIYLEIGISICLILANMLFYSRRIDVIIQKHNVLPEQEQLRNKYRMWIYVVATILSTIGLSIAIELTREKPETEFVHDKARIEIPKLHISDISK
uniref:hypothetical protein n=1 Tax=Alistipes communis TaxID=2585118 RepID=UPI0026671C3A